MPLLEGETLRRRFERTGQPLPLSEVVALALALLETLAAAHRRGIVHRDIKPENLFLTRSEGLKILDFGIARVVTGEAGDVTKSGHAVGTPAFMAPEQALGRSSQIDARTDLWAVGATMFFLLSGKFVHAGQTWGELAAYAGTRPARSIGSVAPEVPAPIRAVVDRALEFQRDDRWPDAGAICDALRAAWDVADCGPIPDLSALSPAPRENDVGVHPCAVNAEVDAAPATAILSSPEAPQTHRLRAAPTRTSTGLERVSRWVATRTTTQGRSERLTRTARMRRNIAFGVIVVGLAALVPITRTLWEKRKASVQMMSAPSEVAVPTGSRSPNPEAQRAYEIGETANRDASFDLARKSFERAAKLDPDFAAAHLARATIASVPTVTERDFYQNAVRTRASLSPRDRALLEAYSPAMQVSPDFSETEHRLLQVARDFPSDFRVSMALSDMHLVNGRAAEAIAIADAMLEREPKLAAAWSQKAAGYQLKGSAEERIDALKKCAELSQADACLLRLGVAKADAGQCAEAEAAYRKILAVDRFSFRGNRALAYVLFSRGAPVECARCVVAGLDRPYA